MVRFRTEDKGSVDVNVKYKGNLQDFNTYLLVLHNHMKSITSIRVAL